jgi:ABC-type molybdenum transport system ATPase subunit/photorepair protein PhrA
MVWCVVFRWNDKDDKLVNIECWVDLDGLNGNGKNTLISLTMGKSFNQKVI